jgi:AraC-like DNA-binding protein
MCKTLSWIAPTKMLEVASLAFVDEMARHQAPAATGGSAEQRFRDLIQQMPDNELVNHSPEQLASICGCSVRHFSRLFRKHLGSTIRGRQTELKLIKARQLLTETDSKIIHVALESGYRHLSVFNLMFKKYLGMTASEWPQKHSGVVVKSSGNVDYQNIIYVLDPLQEADITKGGLATEAVGG